ncbi:MAG: TadE/TadG family type IV pilus assembly protein [Chloroflexota bacterium]
MKKARLSLCRRDCAQGLIEFALILPVILLLIYGMIEISRFIFFYGAVATSSREGARFGVSVGDAGATSLRYKDCDGIKNAALRVGAGLIGLTSGDITIEYDHGTGVSFSSCPPSPDVAIGDRIKVRVQANYDPLLPLVNFPTIPITATTYRTIIIGFTIETGIPIPTRTPYPTFTTGPTDTPTITATPTSTYTPTVTPTASNTPTVTDTPTVSPTATDTSTPTQTFTPVCNITNVSGSNTYPQLMIPNT